MSKYRLTIELSVLEDLGINLYSNVPAVISEAVANAWDADATEVKIDIDKKDNSITISDNGQGMSSQELQDKYLTIGYKRRERGEVETPLYSRAVMGRKGIGKLSLFSIAEEVSVHSIAIKAGKRECNAVRLDSKKIKEHVKKSPSTPFEPEDITCEEFTEQTGTKIVLKSLKKSLSRLETDLRKRLARRFSVLGNNFDVYIGGSKISPQDRDYYNQIQYVWLIGEGGKTLRPLFKNAEQITEIAGTVDKSKSYEVSGWVGTFKAQKEIEDGTDNTIAILARGKLIHEDILKNLKEGGVFTKYLSGDIVADFVDVDEKDDIATSDRQSLKEDDERFLALKEFVHKEIVRVIKIRWTSWRKDAATNEALEIPAIKEWYESLDSTDLRKYAKDLFGTIGSYNFESQDRKKEIYRIAVIALEKLSHERSLSKLDEIKTAEDFMKLGSVFGTLDDIEASMYFSITKGRLAVLEKLKDLVDNDAKERVLQAHIFDHLWLLNPAWERPTENKHIEQRVKTAFDKVTAKLTKEERDGRFDIRYRSSGGAHVIVELKRYSVKPDIYTLAKQINKYRTALEKCLEDAGEKNPHIEVVCILGHPPMSTDKDPEQKIKDILSGEQARYITYDQIINDSIESYKGYLDAQEKAGKIQEIIAKI